MRLSHPTQARRFLASVTTAVALGLASAPAWAAPADTETATADRPSSGVAAPTSPGGVPGGGDGPEKHLFVSAQIYAGKHLGSNPPSANNFSCKPKPGQRPVILISGTTNDAYMAWSMYAPHLTEAGFCVFAPNYNPAIDARTGTTMDELAWSGDIRASAKFLATFVDKVRQATGSDKVDIVGHSQGGGPLPRAYIKWYGGGDKVDKLIGLVPSNQGTTAYGISMIWKAMSGSDQDRIDDFLHARNKASLTQQLSTSQFIHDLNDGGDTDPRVQYVTIATHWDQVVVPYTNAYLKGNNATNIKVQDVCPLDPYNHMNFTYDPVAFQLVRNKLDPSKSQSVNCYWLPAFVR